MDTDADALLLSFLQSSCQEEVVQRAQEEIGQLIQAGLPPKPAKVSKLLHLALRRDVWALLASRPAFGVSQVPHELQIFRSFDRVISECLRDVIRRTEQFVLHTPLSHVAGPWEGGHLADSLQSVAQVSSCRQIFAAWNAQGAFGRSADEALNVDRMLHFAAQLSHEGVTIVVLVEPISSDHTLRGPPAPASDFSGCKRTSRHRWRCLCTKPLQMQSPSLKGMATSAPCGLPFKVSP